MQNNTYNVLGVHCDIPTKKETSDFQVNFACFKTNIRKNVFDMYRYENRLSMIYDKKAHELFNI